MQATRGEIRDYLKIEYIIPGGKQKRYHPHPNRGYTSVYRKDYLPDTVEGRRMLFRFQYAFLNGLCFEVLQSGRVAWSFNLSRQYHNTPNIVSMSVVSRIMTQLGVPIDDQSCYQWIQENQSTLSLALQLDLAASEMQSSASLPVVLGGQTSVRPERALSPSEVLYFDADRSSSATNAYNRYSQHLEPVLVCKEVEKEECPNEECPICLEKMVPASEATTTNVICIKKCRHRFHKQCVLEMFARKHDKCPYCRQPVGKFLDLRGHGPSGSMSVFIDRGRRCEGSEHNSDGIIQIHYKMKGGIQHAFMENPGQRYPSTSRIAYLPLNESGRKLLARLKYAFVHGLTFQVGISLTSERSNQITWSSIHHKSTLYPGAYGYPDPHYFTNCNESLDALGVPKVEDCT
mmetsp:Transcript_20502/g.50985  ORF Transcript_20502/g.50985 Transcript_20502/m.50985 type:complete len:403 (+) Transcript_20502:209-1417(+)